MQYIVDTNAKHRIADTKLFYILKDTANEFTNYKWLCGNRPRITKRQDPSLVEANSGKNIRGKKWKIK